MSQEDIIATRYAKGLAELALEKGEIEIVGRDLAALADLVDPHSGDFSVPEFLDFLNTPVVAPQAKLDATDVILAKMGIGKTVSDFLNVLIEHNRVGLIPNINRQFAFIAADLTREHAAAVFTARPLTADQSERLVKALEKALDARVRLVMQVEPGLLGGMRVEVDGHVIDGTIVGRLESLRQQLGKV